MLQPWEQASLLRTGLPVWPRKQNPKNSHLSEKRWRGGSARRQGLRACQPGLPTDLSWTPQRGRPASGGAWPYCFYGPDPDQERLRMGISKRRASVRWGMALPLLLWHHLWHQQLHERGEAEDGSARSRGWPAGGAFRDPQPAVHHCHHHLTHQYQHNQHPHQ